jgi:EAL domain-containing protein (putative c-di-GMP-specific phosphodiesterase class I)
MVRSVAARRPCHRPHRRRRPRSHHRADPPDRVRAGSRRDGIRTRHRTADGGWVDLELSIANRVGDLSIHGPRAVRQGRQQPRRRHRRARGQPRTAGRCRPARETSARRSRPWAARPRGHHHHPSHDGRRRRRALPSRRQRRAPAARDRARAPPGNWRVSSPSEPTSGYPKPWPSTNARPWWSTTCPPTNASTSRPTCAPAGPTACCRCRSPAPTALRSALGALGPAPHLHARRHRVRPVDRQRARPRPRPSARRGGDAPSRLPRRAHRPPEPHPVRPPSATHARALGCPGLTVGVFVVDLDHFKVINDSLGHELGDALIIEVANRLRDCVRPGDMVARLGGDEFALMCEDATSIERVESIAPGSPRSSTSRSRSPAAPSTSAPASASRSPPRPVPPPPRCCATPTSRSTRRRTAGAAATPSSRRPTGPEAVTRLETESELRRALPAGELRVHYQPTVDLASGSHHRRRGPRALEAPDPRHDPSHRVHPHRRADRPDRPVGSWVLKEACRAARRVVQRTETRPPVGRGQPVRPAAVPARLTSEVALVIGQLGIDPSKLCLEITESALMIDLDRAIQAVRELKTLGLRIAVDDFGTGYSSLSYLTRLPVDVVKIDRSFIASIAHDDQDRAITRGIIDLAHSLAARRHRRGRRDRRAARPAQRDGLRPGSGLPVRPPRRPQRHPARAAALEGRAAAT